jgi:hypothetical protein
MATPASARRLFAPAAGGKPPSLTIEERQMAQAEFIKVQKFLGGTSYPATKEQLVEHARSSKADQDVLDALLGIPDQEYDGPNEVSKAVAR